MIYVDILEKQIGNIKYSGGSKKSIGNIVNSIIVIMYGASWDIENIVGNAI